MRGLDLRRLYDEHAQLLYAFLLNLTRDEADTRDLLQDIFVKLARDPELLASARDERAFLIRLAHNAAIDLIRRRGTRDKTREQFAAEIISPFAPTGDPDEQTLSRVKAFYNGIAVLIEKECGQIAVPMLNITHEGFGRALITVGKLVVMDRTVRDVHRYGYDSFSKMKDEADKFLAVALEIIGKYPEVAGL